MYQFRFINSNQGEIQIDSFVESFDSDQSFWSQQQYKEQWKSASTRLKQGLPSLFITSITEPENSNFIRTWVCYPIDGELVFQERILFLDELEIPFNIENPHQNIDPYNSISDDGDPISEWRTKIS
jgi:hypothetical protein